MAQGTDLAQVIACAPDDRLLGEDIDKLPAAVGRPEEIPPSRARRRVVAVGAALTAITLVLGGLLAAFGAVDFFATGFDVIPVIALFVGLTLIATHWGWVHVAELYGQRLERHDSRDVLARRQAWLAGIEPYQRWEVSASTGEDGSIAITTIAYRPVPCREGTFTFERLEVAREAHSGDEPAATVTERAELLRRNAALHTARERERYEAAHDAYERARLEHADERERLAAVRAASEALSDQINSNLREPPLVE